MDQPSLRVSKPLEGRIVRLEPIAEPHREPLRAAAEQDPEIHRYTLLPMLGFDRWFDLTRDSKTDVTLVTHIDGIAAGSSRFLNVDPDHRRAERPAHDLLDSVGYRSIRSTTAAGL